MSSNLAFVLAPGAWHTPDIFDRVKEILEQKGHTVAYIEFPSVYQTPTPVSDMQPDIQAVRDAVLKELDAGRDVVVGAHSWAGAPVNSALDGLSKKEREAEGKSSGVVKLAFMAAFVVPEGVSVFDALGRQQPPLWNVQGDWNFPNDPIGHFYNDMEPDEQKLAESRIRPHAYATKLAPTTGAAHLKIPSTYLMCELDVAIPIAAQEAMVKGAQDGGAVDFTSERIKTGHSPFFVRPKETAEFLLRAAGTV